MARRRTTGDGSRIRRAHGRALTAPGPTPAAPESRQAALGSARASSSCSRWLGIDPSLQPHGDEQPTSSTHRGFSESFLYGGRSPSLAGRSKLDGAPKSLALAPVMNDQWRRRDEQKAADGRVILQLPWCRAALILAAILADFRLYTLRNLCPDICRESRHHLYIPRATTPRDPPNSSVASSRPRPRKRPAVRDRHPNALPQDEDENDDFMPPKKKRDVTVPTKQLRSSPRLSSPAAANFTKCVKKVVTKKKKVEDTPLQSVIN